MKWAKVERYLLRHGYRIVSRGGDKVIQAPKDRNAARTRQQLYIGHKSCNKPGSEVLACYMSKLKNVFGITEDDINDE